MNQETGAQLLDRLLATVEAAEASDLHLAVGRPPFLRLHGQLIPMPDFPTSFELPLLEEIARALLAPLPWEEHPSGSQDGAITSAREGRFRYNIYRRLPGMAIAIRRLEKEFRTLAQLGLPDSLHQWCELPDGLVLVAGPTGSGKSTTLATLIDRINRERTTHIITIEDPIEYLHLSKSSLIDQRQIGLHAPDFHSALVASLRQDPDVILVGEIRERETIRTALTAAETGHLVFATVHAPDCAGAIQRIVSVFPADEQPGISRQISMNLRGILAQHLIRADGPNAAQHHDFTTNARSRILLSEILQISPAIAHQIAKCHYAQIYSAMETGSALGMQTLEENLFHWVSSGHLTESSALAHTRRPKVLQQRLQRRTSTTPPSLPNGAASRWK